jgi:hypothetical protein
VAPGGGGRRADGAPRALIARIAFRASGYRGPMFVFFSNRLGCLGSILVSVIGTLVILALLGVL